MPFLEVLTRCYKRPKMLAHNQASLQRQTCQDYTQTLLVDDEGRGIGWSYTNMAAYAPHLKGKYIWILDDDDECNHPPLIEELKGIVGACNPDVIMVRMDHQERGILPGKTWECEPQLGGIGCSAYIVKRQIWQRHSKHFGSHYAGDFDFIKAVFASGASIHWHDVIASRVQRISLGAAE